MLLKNTSKICVLLFVASLMLVISACGYHGDESLNIPPTVRITSYTGTDVEQDTLTVPYQQTIYWSAEDQDGNIIGYAYRVLDENGNSIPTPGHNVVDTEGTFNQEYLSAFAKAKNYDGTIGVDPKGWILHYKKGANEGVPLESDEASKTIWTEKVFTKINFPANDGSQGNNTGNLAPVPTRFEVIAIDNRGEISDVSSKFFYTTSIKPSFTVTTTRGEFKDEPENPVGLGIKVNFFMKDNENWMFPNQAWYYEYRVLRVNRVDTTIVEYESDWKSTRGQDKINEIVITGKTDPFIVSNYLKDNNGIDMIPADSTEYHNVPTMHMLQVKVFDLAGVTSDIVTHKFYVSDQYAPQTLFYPTHTYVLGEHHFILQQDTNNIDVHPNQNSTEGMRMATNFTAVPIFDDNNEVIDFQWTVIGDESTRFWFRWGYKGEYTGNNPNSKIVGIVRDSTSADKNYFTEINNFYIQLDGAPYEFGPLMSEQTPENNVKYGEYLKVPANHQIAQKISFNGLTPNDPNDPNDFHEIKVIAEDLQNVLDPTPAVFRFKLIPPKPIEERQGTLYINNNTTDNDGIVQEFYDNVFADMNKDYHYIHRASFRTLLSDFSEYDIRNGFHLFPAAFLQNYKQVIYATDVYNQKANLEKDTDGIRLYLRNSGNVILVGNYRLKEHHENDLLDNGDNLLINQFGFPTVREEVKSLIYANISLRTLKFYFIGADGNETYPSIDPALNYTDETADDYNPDSFIRTWLSQDRAQVPDGEGGVIIITDLTEDEKRNGLASVTFFDNHTADEVLYTFRCKPVKQNDRDFFSPADDAERNLYHGKPVVIRKAVGAGNAYTVGFPLLHMNKTDVRAMLNTILQ